MGQGQGSVLCLGDALEGICGGGGVSRATEDECDPMAVVEAPALPVEARELLKARRTAVYASVRQECAAAMPSNAKTAEAVQAKDEDHLPVAQEEYVAFLANLEEIHSFLQDIETSHDRTTLSLANIERVNALNKKLQHINRQDPDLDRADALGYVMGALESQLARVFGDGGSDDKPMYASVLVHLLCGAYHRLLSEYQTTSHAAMNLKRALDSYTVAVKLCHASLVPHDVARLATEVEYCVFSRVALQQRPRSNALFYAALTTSVDSFVRKDEAGVVGGPGAPEAFADFMAGLCDAGLEPLFESKPRSLWHAPLRAEDTGIARVTATAHVRASGYRWGLSENAANEDVRQVSGVDLAELAHVLTESGAKTPRRCRAESVGSFKDALDQAPRRTSLSASDASQKRRASGLIDLTL